MLPRALIGWNTDAEREEVRWRRTRVPVMISGIRGGRSRRMIGGGERGGGARCRMI